MLHAFSISLVCTGAFWDRSAGLWKEAVKTCSAVMSCYICHVVLCISGHVKLCMVMAATANLSISLMFAA